MSVISVLTSRRPDAAITTLAASSPAAPVKATIPSDTVTISAAAQQASDAGDAYFAQTEKTLKQVHDQLNAYQHQVIYELDHNTAVTAPAGSGTSNQSAGTSTANSTYGQVVNTQVTSALATQVSLQIAGSLGNTQLTFAAGTKLSALAAAVQNVSSYTGVSATASGSTLTFNTTGSGSNQFVSVVTTQGSFNVTPNSKGEAIEQTVADGFSNIESALSYPTVNLTDAQYAKLDADFAQLRAQQTQFQNTVARRTTPNYASLTKQLSSKVNAYEHQVTWQIDNGQPVTGPSDTSKPSTDSKLSQTITSGFGALIADTSKALGTLSPGLATQFGKLKDSLADEQASFIKFAVDRQQKKSA